uniref:Transmembrane protein 44 n=1 Tax=Sarcophilus harrisii TaxID=9305 RepID=A0A7N4PPQ7_SARHA
MRRSLGAAETPLAAAGPASEAPPALGDWDYLARCFARDRVCLSFGLWLLAALLWIAAHVLCFYLGCCKKSSRDRSVLCVIYRFVGSLSDAFGALLSKQLPIQVFTGIYLAAIEVVNLMLLLFPICGSKIRPQLGRGSQERTRRKLRASMFVLIVPLGMGTGWLALAPPAPASLEFRGAQRRLLGSVLQENTEALGYLLGGVGLIVSWTSRIPSFSKIYRGRASPCLHLWARGFSALAGFLYASAIVAHDRRPDSLLRALPWLLTALGASALDLAVSLLWPGPGGGGGGEARGILGMDKSSPRTKGLGPESRGPDTPGHRGDIAPSPSPGSREPPECRRPPGLPPGDTPDSGAWTRSPRGSSGTAGREARKWPLPYPRPALYLHCQLSPAPHPSFLSVLRLSLFLSLSGSLSLLSLHLSPSCPSLPPVSLSFPLPPPPFSFLPLSLPLSLSLLPLSLFSFSFPLSLVVSLSPFSISFPPLPFFFPSL